MTQRQFEVVIRGVGATAGPPLRVSWLLSSTMFALPDFLTRMPGYLFIRLLVPRHLYHVRQLSQSSRNNKSCILRDMNVALQPANYSYRDGYITSASFIKAARATKCCVLRDMNVVVHRSLAPGYLHGRPEVAQTENQPTRFEEKPNYASSAAKNVSSSAQYKRTPWRISSSSIYSSAVWDREESPGPIFTEGMGRRA